MFTEILLLFVSVVFFVNLYISWNDNYWLKQDIPFIEPKKFFGNIKEVILMRKTIGEVYTEIYRKLDGKPLGGFFKLRTPILMVRDPDLIGRVLNDDFLSFHDNDFHCIRDADPVLKMNPFLATGFTWKSTRASMKSCADGNKIKGMFPLVKLACDEMVTYIRNYTVLPVEAKDLSARFTTEVVASLVFGIEAGSFRKPEGEFRRMTAQLFSGGVKTNIALLSAFYFPLLANMFNFRIIPQNVGEYFIKAIRDMCKKRVTENTVRNDFLQDLIDINKESEASGEGTVYNYNQIAGHCLTFLVDGYYTTASTLFFCIYELAMNPECQQKAREEILSRGNTFDRFDYDKIQQLNYLEKVISESLRLHPPIQTMTRVCTKDTILTQKNRSYPVKEGVPVTIPISAIHTDEQYYTEPHKFQPERFDLEEKAKRHRYVYLPFGEGPRICVAVQFALLQIKMALIGILLNFEIEVRDVLKDLQVDPQQSFLKTAKGEVLIKFKEIVA